jgi:hypothetical protein
MDFFLYLGFGGFLLAFAYTDMKYRLVPDVLASLFLCCFAILGYYEPSILLPAFASYAAFYLIVSLMTQFMGVQGFGWMDIIILPIVFALMLSFKGMLVSCALLAFMFLAVGIAGLMRNNAKYGLPMVQAINAPYEPGEPLMMYLFCVWLLSLYL